MGQSLGLNCGWTKKLRFFFTAAKPSLFRGSCVCVCVFLIVWETVTLIAYCFASCVFEKAWVRVLDTWNHNFTTETGISWMLTSHPPPYYLLSTFKQPPCTHTLPPTRNVKPPPCTVQFDLCEYTYTVTNLYLAHIAWTPGGLVQFLVIFLLDRILKNVFHYNLKCSG